MTDDEREAQLTLAYNNGYCDGLAAQAAEIARLKAELTPPMFAALATTLKEECERQHAQVEAQAAEIARLRERIESYDFLVQDDGKTAYISCKSCDVLTREQAEDRAAIRAFLKRYDELMPEVNGLFGFAAVHGFAWPSDKNWAAELDVLRARAALRDEGEG